MRSRLRRWPVTCVPVVLFLGGILIVQTACSSPTTRQLPGQRSVPRVISAPESVLDGDVKLVCTQPEHDVGTFWAGHPELICHWFEVVNEGSATVWVRAIHSFIGTGPKPLFELRPGLVTEIPLCVKTTRLRGRFSRSVRLQISSPPQQKPCEKCGLAWSSHPHGLRPWAPPCIERQ